MLAGGYYFGFLNDSSGGNFFAQTKVGSGFSVSPSVDLNLDVDYSYYFGGGSSLSNTFNGIGISIGISYRLGAGSGKSNIDIPILNLSPIYPVLHETYDSLPLGSIVVKNGESGAIEDVRVSYFIPSYMDSPRQTEIIPRMERNQETEVSLHALLDKSILDETEGTAANSEINITYKFRGIEKSYSQSVRADILYRNALVWDDDRKAASFVTAKDPAILTLSRNSLNVIRDFSNQGTDSALRQGMAVYEALRIYGLSYVIDPDSSYEELSAGSALDFIQFPVETLIYKAGDCDDLSVLFSSLMESLSVETAFITVPGHIYTAIALETDPKDAGALFPRSQNDLIQRDGKLWVPVEVTLIESEGFAEAWRVGASEWHKYSDQDKAGFWPIQEAWQIYKPVGLISSSVNLEYPSEALVSEAFGNVLTTFIAREIRFRVMELEEEINNSSGRDRQKKRNSLGVLYARNGMYDDAIRTIRPVATGRDIYLPAVLNLANLYYLTDNLELAVQYYRSAAESLINPKAAYLGLAMVENKRGNTVAASEAYYEFAALAPERAEKYAFLAGSQTDVTRASSAFGNSKVLWEDEE